MTHELEQLELSPEGERRREAILRDVSERLPAIARRRRAKRRAVAGTLAVLLLAGAAVVWMIPTMPTPTPTPAPRVVETIPTIETDPLIDYAVVESAPVDPSIYVRTETESINAMVISDDELLRELAAMGRPAGLIRMNGRVRLSRDVVDPPADPVQ